MLKTVFKEKNNNLDGQTVNIGNIFQVQWEAFNVSWKKILYILEMLHNWIIESSTRNIRIFHNTTNCLFGQEPKRSVFYSLKKKAKFLYQIRKSICEKMMFPQNQGKEEIFLTIFFFRSPRGEFTVLLNCTSTLFPLYLCQEMLVEI